MNSMALALNIEYICLYIYMVYTRTVCLVDVYIYSKLVVCFYVQLAPSVVVTRRARFPHQNRTTESSVDRLPSSSSVAFRRDYFYRFCLFYLVYLD